MAEDTILDILTQKSPELNHERQSSGPNTKGNGYVRVDPAHVTLWNDFTFEAISAAYGDLLSRKAPDDSHRRLQAEDITPSERDMVNEDAVDFFFKGYFATIIKKSMKECSAIVRRRLGLPPAEPSLRPRPRSVKDDLSVIDKISKPDWIIHVHPDGQIFVVGESKLSSKWRSQLKSNFESSTEQRMRPIRQIATYCTKANTRYGFLFTPLELVAVRVHAIPGSPGSCGVEYRPIRYSNWGGQTLTVNLALWALAMMGANEKVRDFAPRCQYVSLNSWTRKTGSGSRRLVHCISGREMDEQVVRCVLGDSLIIHPDHGSVPVALPIPAALRTRSPSPAYLAPNKTPRRNRSASPLSSMRSVDGREEDGGLDSPADENLSTPLGSKRKRH
ncbi:hypothetical protein V8F20_011097 [Naviculisporaceae sp. PSN 640]